MSISKDLADLAEFMQLFDSGKLDNVYGAIATAIGGKGAKDIAEATEALTAAGQDPAKFIPIVPSYSRSQEREARIAIQAQREAQRLRHEEERHQLEMRKLAADVKISEDQATRLGSRTSA